MKFPQVKNILIAVAVLPLMIAQHATAGIVAPPPVFIPPTIGPVGPVFVPPLPVASKDLSDEATAAIEKQLLAASLFCTQLSGNEYTIDCLGDAFQQIAKSMPNTGDYADAQAAIEQAARKLRALARTNASPELPRGYVRSTGPDAQRSSSPLTPVRTDTMAQTNAAALAILLELETILLRSAENSALRRVHYERIALAVGSNKVLLRST